MRLLIVSLFLVSTTSSHATTANEGPWLDQTQDFYNSVNCKSPLVEKNGWQFTCAENDQANNILAASTGELIPPSKSLEIIVNFYDAAELQVLPEEETMRYVSEARGLYQAGSQVEQEPTLVGYTIYSRYMNELLGADIEITARYNLKGDLIKAQAKEL